RQAALPERYAHEAAGRRRRWAHRCALWGALWDEIVERLGQRQRQQNPNPSGGFSRLAEADRRWLAGTGVIVGHRLDSLSERRAVSILRDLPRAAPSVVQGGFQMLAHCSSALFCFGRLLG